MTASVIPDFIQIAREDKSRGWKVLDGSRLTADIDIECDVVIVG